MAHNIWQAFSILLWLLVALPTAYLYTLALAAVRQTSVRTRPGFSQRRPDTRFAIVIPAHNEESVIGETVQTLRRLDYPSALFDIHVAADYCTDRTAAAAHAAGAIVHERNEGPRAGKGAVLAWAFERILRPSGMQDGFRPAPSAAGAYRAVVVFDADTQVAPDFLRLMDARLAAGARAIQGQHRISNPGDSWYASLTAAMMTVQNRLQNQGRSNLGLSAFNMGDSICIEATLLRSLGWGVGLTEDYDLRFHLLSSGVRIVYEPNAVGLGEAPASWAVARRQRERWLAGTYRSSRRHRAELLKLARTRGTRRSGAAAAWDALLQALFPAYSTLILLAGVATLTQAGISRAAAAGAGSDGRGAMTGLWIALVIALLLYPILGLLLARAPGRAYAAVFLGPVFAVWRTWLALSARFLRRPTVWVRTPRRGLGR
jgi:cellulose synthase/poly-beta-1,6-N-acetylglucosamine synthase-like glycosyltransferase